MIAPRRAVAPPGDDIWMEDTGVRQDGRRRLRGLAGRRGVVGGGVARPRVRWVGLREMDEAAPTRVVQD